MGSLNQGSYRFKIFLIDRMATLLKGDCLEIMKGLPAKSVDCFICDLPYGSLVPKEYEKMAWKGVEWDNKINLVEFWKQVKRLCKNEHTPVLMFCNTKFGYELIASNPKWFRYDLVWDKGFGVSFLLANKIPMKSHEMIYVFSKAGAYYNRVDIEGSYPSWRSRSNVDTSLVKSYTGINKTKGNDGTTRCALSVISLKKEMAHHKNNHPTEKPKEVYRWLLERYCPKDGLVLDPTAGSFNSIIVARELGIRGIGIEQDDKFFWTAVNKIIT